MLIMQLVALLYDVDDVKLSPETHETKKNAVDFMIGHRQAVMENYLAEFMAEWEGEK